MKLNEMTTEEKLEYIRNYPIKSTYLCESEKVFDDEDTLSEALSGVGFYIVTGKEMAADTKSSKDSSGNPIEIDGFYLCDVTEAEVDDVQAYTYIGKEIKGAIESAADCSYLQMDFIDSDEYEIIEIDNNEIEYDFIERSVDLHLYEQKFMDDIPPYLLSMGNYYPTLRKKELGEKAIGIVCVELHAELEGVKLENSELLKRAEKEHAYKTKLELESEYEWHMEMLSK